MVVPADVGAEAFERAFAGISALENLVGLIVTVPHKVRALSHCHEITAAARAVGAVNVIRNDAGHLVGDMLDGRGCLAALGARGHEVRGRSALLVGAGGAGSAIADALAGAGLARLVVHDIHRSRADALVVRLAEHHPGCAARPGPPYPTGKDLVINATPQGMRPGDPPPLDPAGLEPSQVVVDVVPKPEITPLLEAARARGCAVPPGTAMFDGQMDLMVAFFARTQPIAPGAAGRP